jgi:hypothetical protein
MDKNRQIRLLYSPLILVGAILVGAYFDNPANVNVFLNKFLFKETSTNIIVDLLSATSLITLIGYVIGLITNFILKLIFFKNKFSFEIKLSQESFDQIGKLILNHPGDRINAKDRFYAGVTFDHQFILPGVHQWIVRRWNSFYISSTAIVALVLSCVLGHWLLGIRLTCAWIIFIFFFSILLSIQSYLSWKETMQMIEFQARVKKDSGRKELISISE